MRVDRHLDASFPRAFWDRPASSNFVLSLAPPDFSNRQIRQVGTLLTHSKQTLALPSNRQKPRHSHWQLAKPLREKCSCLLHLLCYIRRRTRVPPHGPARQRPRNPSRAGAFPYFCAVNEPRILQSRTLGRASICRSGASESEGDSCACSDAN